MATESVTPRSEPAFAKKKRKSHRKGSIGYHKLLGMFHTAHGWMFTVQAFACRTSDPILVGHCTYDQLPKAQQPKARRWLADIEGFGIGSKEIAQ